MGRKKSNSFVSNVMIILTAQIAVKVLGMLYRTVITNIDGFGDAGNGYYSAGFQVYTLLLALSSVGIPNAISKLVAEKTALGDYVGAKKIFKTSLLIFSAVGAVLSVGMFFLSGKIASVILNMDGAKYTIAALSPSIFFVCMSSVFRGYFSGINKMHIMSISQIAEQIFKTVFTILFVLMSVGCGAEYMSAYANFATTVATVFSALYLVFAYKYKNDSMISGEKAAVKTDFMHTAKKILMIAIPISLCSVISAINRIIDTATVTRGIEEAFKLCIPGHDGLAAVINPTSVQLGKEAVRLSGMLSKSDTLINMPLALNIALATVLVPSISKCNAEKNMLKIKGYISSSFLTSVVLIVPCAVGYIILAKPIYNMIYPNAPLGFELLQISAVSLVFTALNQTVTGALQGIGKVHVPAVSLAAGCIVKLVSNIILIRIPFINIYGAAIGSILCQLVVFIMEFHCLLKFLSDKINVIKIFFKPLICSSVMGIAAYFIYAASFNYSKSNIISVALSVVISAAVYGAGIICLKVFSHDELIKMPVFGKIYMFFEKKHIRIR